MANMKQNNLPLLGVTLLLALLSAPGHGININNTVNFKVYRDLNLRGLIYEFEMNSKDMPLCQNLASYAVGIAGSVKTDHCLLAFEESDCRGKSVKLLPETEALSRLNKKIYSFHACNATQGGKKIRTNFFQGNTLIAEYQDVCGCQNLPTQVTTKLTKLDNFGNCVTVYSKENCRGDEKDVVAGRNDFSENLGTWEHTVSSIKACGLKPECVRLDAKVYKFVLDFPEPDPGTARQVELAARTTFFNNGSATVTQEYQASKTIRESFTVTRSKTITKMRSHSVESGVEVTVSSEFSMFGASASASATASLKYAYNQEDTEENSEGTEYTHEEEKTFTITQSIQIPPCVEYKVNSMVAIMDNVEIMYWVYTKVTGLSSGVKLTAADLKQHVEDLEWVEDYDDYTAIFKSPQKLRANVGVDTWITGEGTKIEYCKESQVQVEEQGQHQPINNFRAHGNAH